MSFEKVNPSHPDKVADRIAGAIVDLAYEQSDNPKIAVEVLIGHGKCHIITETSVNIDPADVAWAVDRITKTPAGTIEVDYQEVTQDPHLAANQAEEIRCGDNGIFKGVDPSDEEIRLSALVGRFYGQFPTDGKFISNEETKTFIACQSNITKEDEALIEKIARDALKAETVIINPLGPWTGGTDVDTGATNRKLGSDMGRAVTGGGLHGKDLSKADVSVNIACHLLAKKHKCDVEAFCAIGDKDITFTIRGEETTTETIPYKDVVEMARKYVKGVGGFEMLAFGGLV